MPYQTQAHRSISPSCTQRAKVTQKCVIPYYFISTACFFHTVLLMGTNSNCTYLKMSFLFGGQLIIMGQKTWYGTPGIGRLHILQIVLDSVCIKNKTQPGSKNIFTYYTLLMLENFLFLKAS